jgi:anti-anti-sigma factor
MTDRPWLRTRYDEHGDHPRPLVVRSMRHGDAQIVELVGELDIEGSPQSRRELARACAAGRRTIVLDLGGLTFMDSCGVHMIIEAHEHLSADGRELVIVRAPGQVRRILDLCGLTPVLHLSDVAPPARPSAARETRVRQAAMAAAVRAMRSLDRQRLRPPP